MRQLLLAFVILIGISMISCSDRGSAGDDTQIYDVSATTSPSDAGTVTPSDTSVEEDQQLSLQADAADDHLFSHWSGDFDSTSDNPLSLTVDQDYSLNANFDIKSYELTVNTDGEGTVDEAVLEQKSKEYEHGTVVELTADPDEGWKFVEWTGDAEGSENPAEITVDDPKEVTAIFEKSTYSLDINVKGEGSVTKDPDKDSYEYGTTVTLKAQPGQWEIFKEWTGDTSATNNPVNIHIDEEKEITAFMGPPEVDPLEHERLIGAHYYGWYESGSDQLTEYSIYEPVLGRYGSHEPEVINQHIKWAAEHGINWFSVSWWGEDHYTDETLKNYLFESPLSKFINYSILYETPALLDAGSQDENLQIFKEDLIYLANNYFHRDKYLKINGRPALFLYSPGQLDVDGLSSIVDEVTNETGFEPYIIIDSQVDTTNGPLNDLADSFSKYHSYTGEETSETFSSNHESSLESTQIAAQEAESAFIPFVIPGFDDRAVRNGGAILEPTPQDFRNYVTTAKSYIDNELKAILITSFNEWHESTQVEPSEKYGKAYLEVVREVLVE